MVFKLPKKLLSKYKPICYWGWLDKIEPEEVKWQVHQMHDVGLGGYIMHARGGRRIPYMGKEWMKSVRTMIKEGNCLEMDTWIDDEDGWPSGFGAGKVTDKGELFWQKYLTRKEISPKDMIWDKYTLGIYALNDHNIEIINEGEKAPEDYDVLIKISYEVNPQYSDLLDRVVVKAFIESAYDPYYNIFNNEFGKGIAGFFTDEPQLRRGYSGGSIPWSLVIPEEFNNIAGYDIVSVLPALFYKVKGYEKVRYDF